MTRALHPGLSFHSLTQYDYDRFHVHFLGYKHWKGQVLNSEQLWELFDGLKSNNIHHYTHLLTGEHRERERQTHSLSPFPSRILWRLSLSPRLSSPGYSREETFLSKVADIIRDLKANNPDLFYSKPSPSSHLIPDRRSRSRSRRFSSSSHLSLRPGHGRQRGLREYLSSPVGSVELFVTRPSPPFPNPSSPPRPLAQYVPENLMPVYRDLIIPFADVLTPNQFELE
jgi:hypothetical protein